MNFETHLVFMEVIAVIHNIPPLTVIPANPLAVLLTHDVFRLIAVLRIAHVGGASGNVPAHELSPVLRVSGLSPTANQNTIAELFPGMMLVVICCS